MRKIKFRAWDWETMSRIFDMGDLSYEWFPNICLDDSWENLMPHIELMQYTGLKDKEWKDIYEWDIIIVGKVIMSKPNGKYQDIEWKWKIIFMNWWFVVDYSYNNKQETEMDKSLREFTWMRKTKFSTFNPLSWFRDIEIIWNIYETPDLLEQWKN